jgi:hypothetical protein
MAARGARTGRVAPGSETQPASVPRRDRSHHLAEVAHHFLGRAPVASRLLFVVAAASSPSLAAWLARGLARASRELLDGARSSMPVVLRCGLMPPPEGRGARLEWLDLGAPARARLAGCETGWRGGRAGRRADGLVWWLAAAESDSLAGAYRLGRIVQAVRPRLLKVIRQGEVDGRVDRHCRELLSVAAHGCALEVIRGPRGDEPRDGRASGAGGCGRSRAAPGLETPPPLFFAGLARSLLLASIRELRITSDLASGPPPGGLVAGPPDGGTGARRAAGESRQPAPEP